MKTVLRNVRSPRRWNPGKSLDICDDNGIVVAVVRWRATGLIIDHLAGYDIRTSELNGLGQYRLDGEPDKPYRCPHCDDFKESWDVVTERVVCKGCGGAFIEG